MPAETANAELAPALERLTSRAEDLLAFLPLLAVAALIVLAFAWIAGRIGQWRRPFARLTPKPFLQVLLAQVTGYVVLAIGVLAALELLDATTVVGAVLGAAGIVGITVGFAFRDTAENYIAGFLLGLRQPFEPQDHVVIEGHEGLVMRLTPRATVLLTLDGNHVRVPNALVFKSIMQNYTRNPRRRFEFDVGIAVDVDTHAAVTLATRTVSDTPGVLDDPKSWTIVESLGASNVVLRAYGWVDQREADFAKVRSAAIRRTKEAFDAARFEMPEPIYRLRVEGELPHVETGSRAPAALETPRQPIDVDVAPDREVHRQVAEERSLHSADDDLLDAPRDLE